MKNKNIKKITILSSLFILIILILTVIIISILNRGDDNNITYNEVETLLRNKDSAIIYYYNSVSTNNKNKEIKKYLNENNIKYYSYDDKNVDKIEYNKLLHLLSIDKDLFGYPAIIYIKDGQMYGNLINIDNNNVVKDFIDNYDLYTIK